MKPRIGQRVGDRKRRLLGRVLRVSRKRVVCVTDEGRRWNAWPGDLVMAATFCRWWSD